MTGVFARPLEVLFGTRNVVIVGGFLTGAGLIVASFTTSVVSLTLVLVLTAGKCIVNVF